MTAVFSSQELLLSQAPKGEGGHEPARGNALVMIPFKMEARKSETNRTMTSCEL